MTPQDDTVGRRGELAMIDAITAGLPRAGPRETEPRKTGPPRADAPGAGYTLVGPGDDAAVVAAPDGRVVTSCDVFVEGVHFRTDWSVGGQIGRKAAIAAMADIYAMGAVPTALVVGLAAPVDTPARLVTDVGDGLATAAAGHGAELVGGDLTRSERLMISVTVLGDLQGRSPVLRSGARPGQVVAIAGETGWAAAGLAILSRGFRSPAAVVRAQQVPDPPLAAALAAADAGATAMTDVSDGLLADVEHLAGASRVTIDIDSAAMPVPDKLAEVGSVLGVDPMAWLLTGGEDHVLIATFPAGATLPDPWRVVGRVGPGVRGDGSTAPPLVTVDGAEYDAALGFEHYR